MSRNLTASDRKNLIRLASKMEKGSPERRAILAGLTKTADPPKKGFPVREAYRTIKQGDEVVATRGRKNKGVRGLVEEVTKNQGIMHVWIEAPGQSYAPGGKTQYDPDGKRVYEDSIRLPFQNVDVVKAGDGRRPVKIGDKVTIIRNSERYPQRKVVRGESGLVREILVSPEGVYFQVDFAGEPLWVRATTTA